MGQNGVRGVLDKECVGSENGTADVTFCPLHYRKKANTDEKLFTNPKCQKLILSTVNDICHHICGAKMLHTEFSVLVN